MQSWIVLKFSFEKNVALFNIFKIKYEEYLHPYFILLLHDMYGFILFQKNA